MKNRFWACCDGDKFDGNVSVCVSDSKCYNLKLSRSILDGDFMTPISNNINDVLESIDEFGDKEKTYIVFSFTIPDESFELVVQIAGMGVCGGNTYSEGFDVLVHDFFEREVRP